MNGKRKQDFPNNWQKFKDADSDSFMPHPFIDVMEWKVQGWELPSNVFCIIRATHLDTKKVKEYVYRNANWAERKVDHFFKERTHELCITTHDSQHYVGPNPPSSYDDVDYDYESDF